MLIVIIFAISLFLLKLILPSYAFAHCPLCVAGAGAGLTLSRLLGIDDSITGVWLGAFLGAVSFWTQNSLSRKNKFFRLQIFGIFLYLLVFLTTLWSFYKFNLVGKHGDVFGYDKLTFGMVSGGVFFYVIDLLNDLVIKRNKKVFFPYQRLVVSLGGIFILSIGMFILINYFI